MDINNQSSINNQNRPEEFNKQLLQQIQRIRNINLFKESLIKLTQDEIEIGKKEIEWLQSEADKNAQIVSKDEIENKAAAIGQH